MLALAVAARGASPAVMDVPEREPGVGEITVAVEAASINGFDIAVAAGAVWDSMAHTFPVALGRDYAGTVQKVGAGVESVQVGDRVAGLNMAHGLGPGTIAARVVVDAATVVGVPSGVTAVQAAAVGLAGVTAVDVLGALELESGEVVLVSGATGGVGVIAVQLAAARGARVIATARPGAATDGLRALGDVAVVDFGGDLAAAVAAVAPDGVDAVVHAAGDPAVLARMIVTGGRLASLRGATVEQAGRADVTVIPVQAKYTPPKLAGLLDQVAEGRLAVVVAATYPLADATDALAEFSSGKLGKIVVTVP